MNFTQGTMQLTVVARRMGMADYAELTKPGVTSLILFSTLVGFYLGSTDELRLGLLFHTLVGTALIAGGTAALNQVWERAADAKMYRTRNRPLPAGRLSPSKALWFGIALSVMGMAYLIWQTNVLTALLGALTLGSYLFLYTPLKTRTPHCTLVGAFPGAIPPLIGWAAAQGALPLAAWVLYAILFLWQFPHFLSIAWLYREDYARAGIVMLPVIEPDGDSTSRQILLYCVALLPVSLLPSWLGLTGWAYFAGSLAAGSIFLYVAVRATQARTRLEARRLLQASVFYLPAVYGLMLVDKVR
jgi:protoheme IX farnesyltransferase